MDSTVGEIETVGNLCNSNNAHGCLHSVTTTFERDGLSAPSMRKTVQMHNALRNMTVTSMRSVALL